MKESIIHSQAGNGQAYVLETSAPAPTQPARKRFGLGACALSWLVLLTLFSLSSIVMAAWATGQIHELSYPGAAVYRSVKEVPKGYTAFNLGTGTGFFAPLPDIKHSRSDHGAVAVGNDVYIFGGLSNETNLENENNSSASNVSEPHVLRSVVRYNSYTGVVEEVESMPDPRYRFAHALIDGKIYIAGGMNTFDPPYNETNPPVPATPQDTIMVFDTACSKSGGRSCWRMVNATKLTTGRADCAGAAANGKFYIVGGNPVNYTGELDTVEVYDPVADKVAVMDQRLNTGRGDARAAAINNVIYVVGGYNYGAGGFLNSVEAYDAARKRWVPKAPMIHARGDFAMEVLDSGRMVVAGGETTDGVKTETALHNVEEYDAEEDVWVEKAPLPSASFRASAAHIGERFLLFGGQPTCNFNAQSTCYEVGLRSVFVFLDVTYPSLYVAVRNGEVKGNGKLVRRMGM